MSSHKFNLPVQLQNSSTDPVGANGTLYYNTVENKAKVYENGTWTALASASTSGGGTVTASNGLTKTGEDVRLGGPLTIATTIDVDGSNNLTFDWTDGFGSTGAVGVGGTTSVLDANADNGSFGFTSLQVKTSQATIYHELSTESYTVDIGNSGIDLNATYDFEDYTRLFLEAGSTPNNPILRVETYDDANGVQNSDALKIDKLGFTTSLRNTSDVEIARFEILNAGTTYTDGRATKRGIEYAANYASTYSNRSIVDKQYVVDSIFQAGTAGIITASNGLTKTGSNIALGGALTGNTTITGGSSFYNLILGTGVNMLGSFNVSAQNMTLDISTSLTLGAGSNFSQLQMTSTAVRTVRTFASTNTISTGLEVQAASLGTATHGFGVKIDFVGENSANSQSTLGSVGYIATDATAGAVDSKLIATALVNNISTTVAEMSPADVKFYTDYTTINAGTAGTSGSAALEIISTNKALLLPRVNVVNDVITPVNGMIVHATESYGTSGLTNADVYAYASNSWQPLTRHRIIEQNISGSVTVDLSTGNMFKFFITGNVTNFTFTNETVGRDYTFIFLKGSVNYTFTWATGKYRFSFGTAPVLTDPTANGSSPASSKDIITALCSESGRLDVVITPDLIAN